VTGFADVEAVVALPLKNLVPQRTGTGISTGTLPIACHSRSEDPAAMSLLDEVITCLQTGLDNLDEANTAIGGADDELDNAHGNYTAIGDTERAERVQAARDAIDTARGHLGTVTDAVQEALTHAQDLAG